MKTKISFCSFCLLCILLLSGCGSNTKMKDGYYTAEMSDFSHGWKEYVCILIKQDTIVSAEFNAKNESGFIKAWDNEYMHNMYQDTGTYPNQYTRHYVEQLINGQKNTEVDVLSGASHSGGNFKKLIAAVIKQAQKGDSSVTIVKTEEE